MTGPGTRIPSSGLAPFGGLIVANLILNSWDWKTSNNKIYELSDPVERREPLVRRSGPRGVAREGPPIRALLKWFRLRGFGQGTRNDLPGLRVARLHHERLDSRARPEFDYRGIYRDVIDTVTAADVRWVCGLLNRLSE